MKEKKDEERERKSKVGGVFSFLLGTARQAQGTPVDFKGQMDSMISAGLDLLSWTWIVR